MKSPESAALATSHRLLKGIALFQVLIAFFRLIFERGSWPSVSMMIVGALLMIFCAQETGNDERVEHLKLKAAKAGLLFGTLLVMLFHVGLLFVRSTQSGPLRERLAIGQMALSAFDVLLVVMLITLGCYHYWRWQDGRALEDG